MSKPFNPTAWYWTVAGDASRAYSSAAAGYVPASDPGFVAWRDTGNAPTLIGSEAELAAALGAVYPAGIGALGPRYVPLATIRERVTAAGKWADFAGAVDALPAADRWQLLSLAEGVASNDAKASALLTAIGLDPVQILRA